VDQAIHDTRRWWPAPVAATALLLGLTNSATDNRATARLAAVAAH
jgi:hypothetical protein